jgi:hypothetical protein
VIHIANSACRQLAALAHPCCHRHVLTGELGQVDGVVTWIERQQGRLGDKKLCEEWLVWEGRVFSVLDSGWHVVAHLSTATIHIPNRRMRQCK